MKAVVLGYHEIGYVCLEALLESSISVSALFTHRDDREEEVWFRTPRLLAEKQGIPVFDPENLSGPWADRIRAFGPDYLFSFYYRNMVPREVLDIPAVAPLNLHGSLLPRFRGRCPVNWVLIEGEERTGVTLHVMEEKPDAGDIVAQKEVAIAFDDTAKSLALKLASAAKALMEEILPLLERGEFERRPQAGPSSYYGGRRPEDGVIDWGKSARAVYNLVRAVTHPYPGAFTYLDGHKLFVWRAAPADGDAEGPPGTVVSTEPLIIKAGDGLVRVESLQLAGEDEMAAPLFLARHGTAMKSLGGKC